MKKAWDTGTAEALAYQLRSVEATFEVVAATGQIVEVTAEQVERERDGRAAAQGPQQPARLPSQEVANPIRQPRSAGCRGSSPHIGSVQWQMSGSVENVVLLDLPRSRIHRLSSRA